MKPVLYLHIGRPKTGSTALQRFLLRNAAGLMENGVLYPATGRYQMASHQFVHAYRPDVHEGPGVVPVSAEALWQSLAEEQRETGANKLILSSENFWFVDPQQLPSALDENYKVRVVAYLRRQDNVLVSSFCEEVKGDGLDLDTDIAGYATDPERLRLLDYYSVLAPWGDRFGDAQVHVRVYESLPEGGIAEDFLQFLGLEGGNFSALSRPANPSLPYDVLRILSSVSGLGLGQVPRRQFVAALQEASSNLDADPRFDAAGLFGHELRDRVLANFTDSNARVLARFQCPDAQRLFPDEGLEDHTQPSREFDPGRVSALMASMALIQERKLHRLGTRLNQMEKELERLARLVADKNEPSDK